MLVPSRARLRSLLLSLFLIVVEISEAQGQRATGRRVAVSAVRVQAMMASSECGQASRVEGNHPRVIQVRFRIPDTPKVAIVRTRLFFYLPRKISFSEPARDRKTGGED